jgi:predicted anti-sigma-YlaC factor YlaD
MNCAAFEDRLDAVLAGVCPADEWAEAERHLAGCLRCRRLFEAVRDEMQVLGPGERDNLTRSILARTSGAACGRARELVCDFVDGTLAEIDRDMMAAHLGGCRDCRALAATVSDLARVLPAMAVIEPPADFVASVLRATTDRRRAPGLSLRPGEWWGRALRRPRFSLEVAYVLTVLLILLVGNPVAAFRDASARAVAAAQPPVSRAVSRVAEPLASARSNGEATLEVAQGVFASASARLQMIGRVFDEVLRRGTSAQRRGEPSGFRAVLDAIVQIGNDVWRFWQNLFARQPGEDSGRRPSPTR